MFFVGIDLGTSSIKTVLVDKNCTVLHEVSQALETSCPHDRWSEQDSEDWLDRTLQCLRTLFSRVDHTQIRGIGVTGQMNGLVALDANDQVIRPTILWNDSRTGRETEYLNSGFGHDKLHEHTGNIAFASFTAPKVMWVRDNEPKTMLGLQGSCFRRITLSTSLPDVMSLTCPMLRAQFSSM